VHRESRDLDFFAAPSLNASEFGELVREEAEREGVQVSAVGPASLGYATYLARLRDAAVRLDFAAASSYRLDPFDETAEGVRIASYADLCAGKLHAICDRFAERDFVDLHFILHRGASGTGADEAHIRSRCAELVRDVMKIDPGLDPRLVGQSLGRGVDRAIVGELPLRLLRPVTDGGIQETVRLCVDECARLTVEGVMPGEP
jgi:hypothetical protein